MAKHLTSEAAHTERLSAFVKGIPELVGLSEASSLLKWDKRKTSVYLRRGKFPEPVQRLECGPIWTRKQIEEYGRRLQE